MASPVFVLSSGRSGTFQLSNWLKVSGVDSEHERLFEPLLAIGVERFSGIRNDQRFEKVMNNYVREFEGCNGSVWIDISNALPWVCDEILRRFPDAKFVNLVRDGRKVVLSFYHKFGEDMYESKSVSTMRRYLQGVGERPAERKRFWRPLPELDYYDNFSGDERFINLCWYWNEVTQVSCDFVNKLSAQQALTVRFEDVIKSQHTRSKLLEFMGVSDDVIDPDGLSRPQNVALPLNFHFQGNEEDIFMEICAQQLASLGYGSEGLYDVKY